VNVKTVRVNRKYNLGNYETLDIGYEAELSQVEGDDNQKILDATKELEKLADTYYTMVRFTPDKITAVGTANSGKATIKKAVEMSAKTSTQQPVSKPVEDLRLQFPENLKAKLTFTDHGDYIKIKPKTFLGSENFAKISSIVRSLSGAYISAGKDSHFRVKKQ
jgi:hypothetical protein